MLLHCYPYHRQAGCLANVFPHVYMDVGEALNHAGARSAAVLAEAMELTPFHKMLYSSDAFGLPELHYLGAAGFRRDLARVTGAFVADGAWSVADADRVARPGRGGERPPGIPAGHAVSDVEPGARRCARHWPASSTRRSGSAATCTRIPSCPDPSTARRRRCPRRWVPPTRPRSAAPGGSCASGRSPARAWRSGPSWMPCRWPSRPGCPGRRRTAPCTPAATTCTWPPWSPWPGPPAACELPAGLLAVLQPREEASPLGAPDIVASAAFAAQQPRAVVGVHLQHQLPPGTVAAAAGTVNAAADEFEITVEGTGGHAGYPQLAADPVPALCQAVLALQQIVSRRTDPTHAVVVSVGVLEAGRAPNVIPGTATARGSLRALDEADRAAMHKAMHEIVEHTCRAHGCRGTVTIVEGEPALVNDQALAAASWPRLREAGFTVDTSFRSCGADDFAYYARSAPALMLFVGTGGPVSLHHPGSCPTTAPSARSPRSCWPATWAP